MKTIPLGEYLTKNKITKAEAARQVGVTTRNIYNALYNKVGKKTALKIQEWTGYQVSAVELMGMEKVKK